MTYRLGRELRLTAPSGDVYPSTYMPLDMLALQYLYGPNWQTNAGDTIYKFDPASGPIFMALWDGGGGDTLDFSAYSTDGVFDLRPGHFSTPSEAQRVDFGKGEKAEGSIAMPYLPKGDKRALIENIIVGNGDNTITLNRADNHVTLGTGANQVVVYPSTGRDVIDGFDENDVLDLTNYHVPAGMISVSRDGDDTVITIKEWPDEIRIHGTFAASQIAS
jgi:serralysin